MKLIKNSDNFYTLSFAPGEEVVSKLAKFAKENGIGAGHVTGLGACGKLRLGYYNLDTKEYEEKVFEERLEILSLVGNVSLSPKGKEFVHVHGVFGRSDFSTIGGHVKELVVSGAGEVHIRAFPEPMRRTRDEQTGLNLL